jgi:hypothetical protein
VPRSVPSRCTRLRSWSARAAWLSAEANSWVADCAVLWIGGRVRVLVSCPCMMLTVGFSSVSVLRVAAGRWVEGGGVDRCQRLAKTRKPQDSGFVPITGPVPELNHWKVSADTLKIQMLWCDGVMPNSKVRTPALPLHPAPGPGHVTACP